MASQGVGYKPQIDREKAAEMRRLMSEGGDKAVEKKFGEEAKGTEEYREAQRQQEVRRRQAQKQRERVAAEQAARSHAEQRKSPGHDWAKAQTSDARAQALKDRQKEREQQRDRQREGVSR